MTAFIENLIALTNAASPWLLLGLVLAGLMKTWLPQQHLQRWLGKPGLSATIRAAIIGAPLPLCSCGVVPVAMELHRKGASKGATLSFLVSTPENGVDSVTLSYGMLGPFMAIIRPVYGIFLAILTGILGEKLTEKDTQHATNYSCGGCCGNSENTRQVQAKTTTWEGVRYAITQLYDDMLGWLLIGLIIAGLVMTFLPSSALSDWGHGVFAMLFMLVAGIPMYICATASTPLAAALLLAGISPGTVLVFLLAGPATNLGTLGIIRKELGHRAFLGYIIAISVGCISFGLMTDLIVNLFQINISAQIQPEHALFPAWFNATCSIILVLLAIKPLRRQLLPA
ncbi:SO_0444 family Cu/Zn efflux transporter [Zooshikella ganghwensis]|uniref:SO_0444 family Cu/Zn efflux transporter n=1 Tax=Zooshikella ganghwensis TaxID=202772 RepID=UPI000415A5E1|nr:SO_0444 family Cu/Zn efflux transporter [Zooshikella ganghwensis]